MSMTFRENINEKSLFTSVAHLHHTLYYVSTMSLVTFSTPTAKLELLRVTYSSSAVFHAAGDVWICKPTGLNQGRGIFLVRDLEEFRSTYLEHELPDIGRRPRHVADRIVQR